MAVVAELIRTEADNTMSFGNYSLEEKGKVPDFEYNGDSYKVKTCKEITKLEKNGMFVYESVPGTAVFHLNATDSEVSFEVEGVDDAQITLELEAETEYRIFIDQENHGEMKTNFGGKLILSVDLANEKKKSVKVVKC